MDCDHIAELLQPFLSPLAVSVFGGGSSEPASAGEKPAFLSSVQLQNISTYIDLLVRWNARINLTAIRDPEQIVTRHFGESLFAARCLLRHPSGPPTGKSLAVADIGSGAGFPGLPLKLWAPDISLTLIESNHRKAAFLREVTRALTLTDVNVTTARAETLSGFEFDLVALRAVERFATMLPAAAHLVAPASRLALLISSTQLEGARASLPQFSWLNAEPIPCSRSRILAVAHRPS